MNASLKTIVIPLALAAGAFASSIWLDGYLSRVRPLPPTGYEDTDPTFDGAKVRGFTLGFEGLIADWYWMRSLQYIGGKIAGSNQPVNIDDLTGLNPRLLYPYLNSATDLDPHFIGAYSYGAIVLPAIDQEKAIMIAQKGIVNNPGQWSLYQQLGYIYWKLGRYDEAASAYNAGTQIAGSPPFMKMMAAAMKTEGGSRETARLIYREMTVETDETAIRAVAEGKLKQLDWFDQRDAINTVLSDLKERNGTCVGSLAEITPSLMQIRMPAANQFRLTNNGKLADPTDIPYLLDKNTCTVKIDTLKTGLPPG